MYRVFAITTLNIGIISLGAAMIMRIGQGDMNALGYAAAIGFLQGWASLKGNDEETDD